MSKCFLYFLLGMGFAIPNLAKAEDYSGLDIKGTGAGGQPQIVEPQDRPTLVAPASRTSGSEGERQSIRDEESYGIMTTAEALKLRDNCGPNEIRDRRTKRCVNVDKDPAFAMAAIAAVKCPNLKLEGKALMDACALQLKANHKGAPDFAKDDATVSGVREAFAKIKARNEDSLVGVKRLKPAQKGLLFDTYYEGKTYTIERRGNGEYFYRGYSDMNDNDREQARRNVERLNLDLAYEKALERPDALILVKTGAPQITPKGEGVISDTIITRPQYTIERNRFGIYFTGPSNMSPVARAYAQREVDRLRAQELLASRLSEVVAQVRADNPAMAKRLEEERKAAAAAGEASGGVVVGKVTDPGRPTEIPLPAVDGRSADSAREAEIERLKKLAEKELADRKEAEAKLAAKKAEETRKLEEARKAEEVRKTEEAARLTAEAKKAAEAEQVAAAARKAEEARKAQEVRKVEEARVALHGAATGGASAAAGVAVGAEETESARIARLIKEAREREGQPAATDGMVIAADQQRRAGEAMQIPDPTKRTARQPASRQVSKGKKAGKLANPELFRLDKKDVDGYYTKLGQQRFKGKAGEDDLFIDLSIQARNKTYYNDNGSGELDRRKKAEQDAEVKRLQKNINKVLSDAGMDEKVQEDGLMGRQTQSALDIISHDPELRKKLVELHKKK